MSTLRWEPAGVLSGNATVTSDGANQAKRLQTGN